MSFSHWKNLLAVILFFGSSLAALSVVAQNDPNSGHTASSTNYRLQSDSLNAGGGLGSSASYRLESSVGEISDVATDTARILASGYQAMTLDTFVAVTAPGSVSMSPAIDGTTGGVSVGSETWTVITNNPAGYSLAVKADTAPALAAGSDDFDDYAPAGADPDYTWSTPTTESRFGFTPEGDDVVQKFLNNGAGCNAGALNDGTHCWEGFSLSDETIAAGSAANSPAGTDTIIHLQAEVGSGLIQPQGSYEATIVATVVSL